MRRLLFLVGLGLFLCAAVGVGAERESQQHFGIRIIDQDTRRGIPMVELTTVSKNRYVSDSGGWIAFFEPGLMNKEVFFEVKSHGYSYPKDRFGNRGKILRTTPGGRVTIEVKRENIAERLYRITGQGIYRDSWLLGERIPTAKPLLNGDVVGQDTVQAKVFRDRIYWFWGDTNRPRYPLGHFKTSGATSELPGQGGLSPLEGIDLNYFVDADGFSRRMTPIGGPGAVWLHGMFVLRAGDGEKLIGHYARVKDLSERYEHGLVVFDEASQTFEKLVQLDRDALLYPRGQSLAYENERDEHIYFCRPFPSVRVRSAWAAVTGPTKYESFSCLIEGERYDRDDPAIDRDQNGAPVWGWKKNTDVIGARRMRELVERGLVSKDAARLALRNEEQMIYVDSGSVHWNEYRRRWVMIAGQLGGKRSFLGEIWYAEAESLEGPWVNARHVVSHDRYTFYNPAHHRFFDQDGGRVIFFEGTYATTFSGAKVPTARYDYNQIMYSLSLDDERLNLPVTHPSP